MRTIRTKVYSFNELTEEAKENAISNYRNSDRIEDSWQSERVKSFEAAQSIYSDLYEISIDIYGARLYTWLVNNVVSNYDKVNRIAKHKDGTFSNSSWKYKCEALKSKVSRVFNTNSFEDCPLTGVCYDMDFLQPIYDFLKSPDTNISNVDLFRSMPSYEEVANKEIDYLYSDEGILEYLRESDLEFLENGKIY